MKKVNLIKNNRLSSIFFMEIAEIINNEEIYFNQNKNRILVTLMRVYFNPEINLIKAYIIVYPFLDQKVFSYIRSRSKFYRKLLSKRLRYRVKKIPELHFCATV
ncbi:ribosome-binding factor A [Blattabacterium cuenoti]|uniref:ribosome-binding factor A n=1 Tax=Blattabacterium cuenoti TaxID=1653831 RepID=UPI00163BEB2B|nr:ribosome-binding factor A [Blattabacterium cuenoti]